MRFVGISFKRLGIIMTEMADVALIQKYGLRETQRVSIYKRSQETGLMKKE